MDKGQNMFFDEIDHEIAAYMIENWELEQIKDFNVLQMGIDEMWLIDNLFEKLDYAQDGRIAFNHKCRTVISIVKERLVMRLLKHKYESDKKDREALAEDLLGFDPSEE